jgi:hypothetical protein
MDKWNRLTFLGNPVFGNNFPTKENISLYSKCIFFQNSQRISILLKAIPLSNVRLFMINCSFLGKMQMQSRNRSRPQGELVLGWASVEASGMQSGGS